MFRSFPLYVAGVTWLLLAVSGCASKKTAVYEHESFDDSGTFSRNYPVTDIAACEAARRALLSQGYIISSSDPKLVSGHKSFQQTGETHIEISFNVVCADDGSVKHHSVVFANALQDRYALKKLNNSASLGVGVLGSVSMPIGSTDDSMVKVASETVSSAKFYERYFSLVESFLPTEAKQAAHIPEKPQADLGMPEPKPAPLVEPAPASVETAPVPAAASPVAAEPRFEPGMSQPMAPPPESAPIEPAPADASSEPFALPEGITPPPPSNLPPPTEPIRALPGEGY